MLFTPSIKGSSSGLETFTNLTSTIGLSYAFKSFSLYLEASTIIWDKQYKKLKNNTAGYDQFDYMISLRLSF